MCKLTGTQVPTLWLKKMLPFAPATTALRAVWCIRGKTKNKKTKNEKKTEKERDTREGRKAYYSRTTQSIVKQGSLSLIYNNKILFPKAAADAARTGLANVLRPHPPYYYPVV